jgi:hypothetical protein
MGHGQTSRGAEVAEPLWCAVHDPIFASQQPNRVDEAIRVHDRDHVFVLLHEIWIIIQNTTHQHPLSESERGGCSLTRWSSAGVESFLQLKKISKVQFLKFWLLQISLIIIQTFH